MNDRIKKLRMAVGLTQQEFADRISIKRGTIANYELNRNAPSDSVVALICREFGVNESWLRSGEGDMFLAVTRDEEISAFIGKLLSGETSKFKKKLISILAGLTESEWCAMEGKLRELLDTHEE